MNIILRIIKAITARPNLVKGFVGGVIAAASSILSSFFTRKADAKKYQKGIAKLHEVVRAYEAEIRVLENGSNKEKRKAKKLARQNAKLIERIEELEDKMTDAK